MWFREETNPGCCRGEVAVVTEKGEREEHTGLHKEVSPYHLTQKTRGAEFREFLQPVSLGAWSFRGWWPWLG